MKHVNAIGQFRHVDNSLFTQYMDTYLLNTRTYRPHRLPVSRLEPILNGAEFETCNSAGFFGKNPKIIETQPDELQLFDVHISII
jgi:hypothetical protein